MAGEVGERMLTLDEVAKFLRVSRRTVERYIKKGWLAAIKYDRSVRIRSSEVERFLQDRQN